jgi:hypothetical protein
VLARNSTFFSLVEVKPLTNTPEVHHLNFAELQAAEIIRAIRQDHTTARRHQHRGLTTPENHHFPTTAHARQGVTR